LPGTTLPTKLVAITNENAESVAARLRQASPPVIGRIQEDRLLLDPRTILPHQGDAMMRSLLEICT
ncbi:MAG: L-seryl-tRNA(Sec) selenium transferase, partial [Anaerolineaceae bacterium]